jgi:hypothetical protein
MNDIVLNHDMARLQYEYICLNRICKITEFLIFFPEHKYKFDEYSIQFNNSISELYKAYVSRYITRKALFIPLEYQKHVYNLHHNIYLPSKMEGIINPVKRITKAVVRNYFENLNPDEILLLINDIKSIHII